MPHIKKSIAMFLMSALLGGGAWYLNTTGVLGGISSSVLNTTFVCTEETLSSQESLYEKTSAKHKKAIVIKKKLSDEINALKNSDPNNQLQKKEEILQILTRQINTYYRFMRKYDTCKKEIKFNPTISPGIMSGEAKLEVSQKEYQALAAFEISSPRGLNTYVQSIQFKVGILPELGIMVDKWFLLHDGANPILCQISDDSSIIDCELSGDMPVHIMSGMRRTYAVGAHVTALNGSGSVDIQISKISFNDSRTNSDTQIQSPLLSFGVVPVVAEPPVPTQVTTPSVIPVDDTPASTQSTDSEEVSNPVVQTETETPISDIPADQEIPTDADSSLDNSELSDIVDSAGEPSNESSSETPPASSQGEQSDPADSAPTGGTV